MNKHQLKAHEKLPLFDPDNQGLLGYCQVSKYCKDAGQPWKEIVIQNAAEQVVATVLVYKLHSVVRCGVLETQTVVVDSKNAAHLARAALQCGGEDDAARVAAIEEMARVLAASRGK